MERIRALINKLKEQSEQNANVSSMLITVQMLQQELVQLSGSAPKQPETSKVSVVFPSSANKITYSVKETPSELLQQPHYNEVSKKTEEVTDKAMLVPEPKRQEQSGWLFDPVKEIPTLAQQKEFKEMNDILGQSGSASLNDKLKTEKKELASALNEGPIRDLKKAIGVNDRFVFLSELFRGDETMYERSIKTINNFRIYPEAEYWIERELKVKLGWDENKEAVKQFRQLVKRRFL